MEEFSVVGVSAGDYQAIRRKIVHGLKDTIKQITPYVHNGKTQLDSSLPIVEKLCQLIEAALFFGIKVRCFHGAVPFWGMIERLEACLTLTQHARAPLRIAVLAAAACSSVRTPLGKARAWIRYLLNAKAIDEAIEYAVIMTGSLLPDYYHPHALLQQEEEFAVLIAVLRSLRVIKFNIVVDDPLLNQVPVWISMGILSESGIQHTKVRSSSSQRTTAASSPSFFSSLTGDLSELLSQASRFIATEGGFDVMNMSLLGYPLTGADDAALTTIAPDGSVIGLTRRSASSARPKLFGSSLLDLVLDDRRCVHAHLEPRLGVPTQPLKLLTMLSSHLDTPGLFRVKGDEHLMHKLRSSLEEEHGIPEGVDIHTVAQCFLLWLHELPEPLLGYDKFDAIIACAEGMEHDGDRIRNISLLVQEAPWYAQPLLARSMALFSRCIHHKHCDSNGLNAVTLAVFLTPCLLRPKMTVTGATEIEGSMMAAAAAGSVCVEFMLKHDVAVFHTMRESLQNAQNALTAKCKRLKELQFQIGCGIHQRDETPSPTSPTSPESHATAAASVLPAPDASPAPMKTSVEYEQLARKLFHHLEATERMRAVVSESAVDAAAKAISDDCVLDQSKSEREIAAAILQEELSEEHSSVPLSSILASTRWDRCGFPGSDPLIDFSHGGGTLAVRCLLYFLIRYKDNAAYVISKTAEERQQFCSVPNLCIHLTRFAADLVGLTPTPSTPDNAQLQFLSTRPVWQLLNDVHAIQEVFSVGLFTFDEAWRQRTESKHHLPTTDTYQDCLVYTLDTMQRVIDMNPSSVEDVWVFWTQDRINSLQSRADRATDSSCSTTTTSSSSSKEKESPLSASTRNTSSSSSVSPAIARHLSSAAAAANTSSTGFEEEEVPQDLGLNHFVHSSENHEVEFQSNICGSCFSAQDAEPLVLGNGSFAPIPKAIAGIGTTVVGGSSIMSPAHVQQLEASLPQEYQCLNWVESYRMSRDGASIETLIRLSKKSQAMLLVIRDSKGSIFGAMITDRLRDEGDKYYGNGMLAVWSFSTGACTFHRAVGANPYYMLTSLSQLAFGGGGHFAIHLDGDLNKGTSGPCATFNSPQLSRTEEFQCIDLELFRLQPAFL